MIAPFKLQLCPGSTDAGPVYVTIEWDGKGLSFVGVEGPTSNGGARGSSGQCVDSLRAAQARPRPSWTPETVGYLADLWGRWHLSSMRPGCEHQRAEAWDERRIDESKPRDAYGRHFPGQRIPSWNMLAWVTRKEHPAGLLSFPCPVCGYKYGSAWLVEPVPDEVLVELQALPQDHSAPACWQRE